MKVWLMECVLDTYRSFQLVNLEKSFYRYVSNSLESCVQQLDNLNNIEIENIGTDINSDISMFWVTSGMVIFNEHAKDCLGSLLEKGVEFIPIEFEEETLYIVNILNVVDAVDYEKAVYKRLKTGLIVGLEKYAFIKEKVAGNNMFRILLNNIVQSIEIWVSDEFKEAVEKNNITGVKFEEIWDSDK